MGQLVFQAALGGQVNLVGPNTASTYNLNVPAVAGNIVTTGDTATVTSTMISGPLTSTVGGTGLASYTAGDITYYASGTALSKLAIGTANYVLTSSGTAPQWTASTGSGSVVLASTPTINNQTVTNYTESVVAIGTVTSSSTLSLTNGTVQTATLTASTACTFTMPTSTAGKSFILLLKQAASTGNGTATFTGVKWGTLGAPTITATAGKMDILSFISDGTNWYGNISQGYTP
jgi:hypothetical protein